MTALAENITRLLKYYSSGKVPKLSPKIITTAQPGLNRVFVVSNPK